jgi:hypothetical protein
MIVRIIAAASLFAAAIPTLAQHPPVPKADTAKLATLLAKGESIEGRVDGDLNGDGLIDTAFVGRGGDSRTLYVALAVRAETFFDHDLVGKGPLSPDPLGGAELSIARGVLTVKDLVGGTTATQGVYRVRWDPSAKKMRLIGLDTRLYSRTYAHDGRETSWNLLTGDRTSRKMTLVKGGGGYANGPIVRSRKPTQPVYIDVMPDIEE